MTGLKIPSWLFTTNVTLLLHKMFILVTKV